MAEEKSDWADEIASKLQTQCSGEMYEAGWYDYEYIDPDDVAAALRKAKADGVREAIMKRSLAGENQFANADNYLRYLADKIERGEL